MNPSLFPARRRRSAALHKIALWFCFFLSGAAALALEMLWMRSAALVLGQTPATTATVLACYFAGLGCGAAAGRRVGRRPVRVYARLELGVAAAALWSLALFRVLRGDEAQAWLTAAGSVGGIAAIAAAVLPATLCLGATLPALGQALVRADDVGRRGGALYAVNTLGGTVGIAAAGFGLAAIIGVASTYILAAAASATAGAVAFLVAGRHDLSQQESTIAAAAKPAPHGGSGRGRLRLVAAGAGALGLGLEVVWTRLFAQVLHNSIYSFSAIALVFLLALASGAGLGATLLRRGDAARVAAVALLSAGCGTTLGVWVFVRETNGLGYVGMHTGLGEYLLRIVALASVTVGPTALASGMVLPALWAAWGEDDGAARPLGDLAAANTLGAIAGSLAAGFVVMPLLGLRGAVLLTAVSYVVLAEVIAPRASRLRPLGCAILLGLVLADPLRAPMVHLASEREVVHAVDEGASGIVSVVESDGDLQLRLDNDYVLGGSAAATNERRLGLVPLLLHPAPQSVAFVGLATGITASAAPALGVPSTTVIELVPEVAEMARTYFSPWNDRLLGQPGVRLVLDDGRRYLASSRERYDVIVSDLFVPWHAGAGSLYTREMYATVARRLAPGGLFCQWLPLYQLTREEFDMIVRTFLAELPRATLWRADFYPNRPVVGLVGQLAPSPVDLEGIGARLDRLTAADRDPLLATPRGFAMLYAGDLGAAADLFAPAPLNRDDQPLLEFEAPRLTRISADGDKDWFTGAALASFYDELARRDADATLPRTPAFADARRAGTLLYRYAVAAAQHDVVEARRYQAEVRALVPEVVAAGEADDGDGSAADADRALAGLRAQQEQVRHNIEEIEARLAELQKSEPDGRSSQGDVR